MAGAPGEFAAIAAIVGWAKPRKRRAHVFAPIKKGVGPALTRLGTADWERVKRRVKEAVEELALPGGVAEAK